MFELDPFSQDLDDADLDDDIFSDDEDSYVPNYKSRTRMNTFSSAIVLRVPSIIVFGTPKVIQLGYRYHLAVS